MSLEGWDCGLLNGKPGDLLGKLFLAELELFTLQEAIVKKSETLLLSL